MAAKKTKWAEQAALEALLKYGPEESGLEQLMQTAKDQYGSSVKAAQGTALLTQQAARTAGSNIDQVYDQTGIDQQRTADTLVTGDLAKLGGAADSIKAGAAQELAVQLGNLRTARAAAKTDFANREVQAGAGAQFATENARKQLESDLSKVFTQKQSLSQQKGAYTALTTQQLQQAARDEATKIALNDADNAQSERNSVRTSGIDPDTGAVIPGGKADKAAKSSKPKLLTPEKHLETQSSISKAVASLQSLDPDRTDRHETAPLLINGIDHAGTKPTQVYDPKTGKKVLNADGTPKMTAGAAGFKAPGVGGLAASVAADMYYDGHLSRRNQRLLNQAGFSVRELGLTTARDWRLAGGKAPKKKATPKKTAAGWGSFALGG